MGQCLRIHFDGLSAYRTSGLKTCLLGSLPPFGSRTYSCAILLSLPSRSVTACTRPWRSRFSIASRTRGALFDGFLERWVLLPNDKPACSDVLVLAFGL